MGVVVSCVKKIFRNYKPVLDLSEPLLSFDPVQRQLGDCGLCLTKDIPMANKLFCIHCHEFYFE